MVARAKKSAAAKRRQAGRSGATFIGARRQDGQVRVTREVTTRTKGRPVVRFEAKTLPLRSVGGRRGKPGEWLSDPDLGPQLLGAFAEAVKNARKAAKRRGARD